ncbi:type 2 isopentenyl-diphosphate Delta-isomerase [Pendulispora brunnea]|uniref:Isopentenyl-diphosphate delta-isomerase n=1 Tax=Pendulispora brunnea TaxID=2905690 RepID=A0ABZ2JYC9_9BACT
MSNDIEQRKAEHLALCATGDVGFRNRTPGFDQVRLVHNALPELDADRIDTSTVLFGKKLRAPILIAAMTGGAEVAGRVNRALASVAEARGYAFGLGSQRAMHVRSGIRHTYDVRDVAPSTVVMGNLGLVQARQMTTAQVRALIDDVGADALCIHTNPSQELVQPGGERDFRGGLAAIARLVSELGKPVLVKEVGSGISPEVAARLRSVGVAYLDVSGAGGTSWVGVETLRAGELGDEKARSLGEAFWDWGIPTAACVALSAPLGFEAILATGGVSTGLDVAKALALGATAAGIARPALRAFHTGGLDALNALFDRIEGELRAAMFLTGSGNVGALRRAPRIVSGELASWLQQIGGQPVNGGET